MKGISDMSNKISVNVNFRLKGLKANKLPLCHQRLCWFLLPFGLPLPRLAVGSAGAVFGLFLLPLGRPGPLLMGVPELSSTGRVVLFGTFTFADEPAGVPLIFLVLPAPSGALKELMLWTGETVSLLSRLVS